jgi:hypothetical protein
MVLGYHFHHGVIVDTSLNTLLGKEFKNKKFRARSRRRYLTHGIETSRVETTHVERKNSVIGNQDNDKDTKKPKNKRARQKKQHKQEDYTFSQNQYEDYLTLNGIVNRTGAD